MDMDTPNLKCLNNFNLNFVMDNLKVDVHHFFVEDFAGIQGFEDHQHSTYELHYIKSGQGKVRFETVTYQLNPGDLYLCAPQEPHSQRIYNNHMVEYSFRFHIEYMDEMGEEAAMEEGKQLLDLLKSGSAKLAQGQWAVERLYESCLDEAYRKKPGFYIRIKQAIMAIIIETARGLAELDGTCRASYKLPDRDMRAYRMAVIDGYIKDNLAHKLTNHDIAKYIYVSERQLYRIIKAHTGLSTHQYIEKLRMNRVKAILQQQKLNLRTIASMTGYSSAFHLSASFKKYTGMSPKEYLQLSGDQYTELTE